MVPWVHQRRVDAVQPRADIGKGGDLDNALVAGDAAQDDVGTLVRRHHPDGWQPVMHGIKIKPRTRLFIYSARGVWSTRDFARPGFFCGRSDVERG